MAYWKFIVILFASAPGIEAWISVVDGNKELFIFPPPTFVIEIVVVTRQYGYKVGELNTDLATYFKY